MDKLNIKDWLQSAQKQINILLQNEDSRTIVLLIGIIVGLILIAFLIIALSGRKTAAQQAEKEKQILEDRQKKLEKKKSELEKAQKQLDLDRQKAGVK